MNIKLFAGLWESIPLKVKSVFFRFLKAFFSSAFATMAVVLPFSGNSWKDTTVWFGTLLMAGIIGGITGVVQGYEKWMNWVE